MNVDGKAYQSIWWTEGDPPVLRVIDQRWLPHRFVVEDLDTVEDVAVAIREMHVRGAPLIGVAAACGMYLAARAARSESMASFEAGIRKAATLLKGARPTAVNLSWAVDRVVAAIASVVSVADKVVAARAETNTLFAEEIDRSRSIGTVGVETIREISSAKVGGIVNILTHCNAGWLCTVDGGTATAPIYRAFDEGIALHVWVDETRPRNQGARLTAWELGQHGVPHTVIVDNAGGHLMQRGLVDIVIVGTDRTTYKGDVVNKIGTYQKALAAFDNSVPFYVAAPSSSIDWTLASGTEVPIEERGAEEVSYVQGRLTDGSAETARVLVTPENSRAANYAFDVTPARLVTGLITERGICAATEEGIRTLFAESDEDQAGT